MRADRAETAVQLQNRLAGVREFTVEEIREYHIQIYEQAFESAVNSFADRFAVDPKLVAMDLPLEHHDSKVA